jgi:hypothetical protein
VLGITSSQVGALLGRGWPASRAGVKKAAATNPEKPQSIGTLSLLRCLLATLLATPSKVKLPLRRQFSATGTPKGGVDIVNFDNKQFQVK